MITSKPEAKFRVGQQVVVNRCSRHANLVGNIGEILAVDVWHYPCPMYRVAIGNDWFELLETELEA
jgi:hypothetical protein